MFNETRSNLYDIRHHTKRFVLKPSFKWSNSGFKTSLLYTNIPISWWAWYLILYRHSLIVREDMRCCESKLCYLCRIVISRALIWVANVHKCFACAHSYECTPISHAYTKGVQYSCRLSNSFETFGSWSRSSCWCCHFSSLIKALYSPFLHGFLLPNFSLWDIWKI